MDEYEDEYSEYETESEQDSDRTSNQKKEHVFNSNIPHDILGKCNKQMYNSQSKFHERIDEKDLVCKSGYIICR